MISIHATNVSKYRRGLQHPDPETLAKINAALGANLSPEAKVVAAPEALFSEANARALKEIGALYMDNMGHVTAKLRPKFLGLLGVS
jgi:hypothetical protein